MASAAADVPDRSATLRDDSALVAARAAARVADAPSHRSSQPPPSARRTPPPRALLPITLGAYLRRLRDVWTAIVEPRPAGRSGSGRQGSVAEALELLQAPGPAGTATDVLAAALRNARLHGTAIGTAASLAAEAVRRGAKRALMALRSGAPHTAKPLS